MTAVQNVVHNSISIRIKQSNWLTIHILRWCLGIFLLQKTVQFDADLLNIALHWLCCYAEVISRKMMNYTQTLHQFDALFARVDKKPTMSHEFHQNKINMKMKTISP